MSFGFTKKSIVVKSGSINAFVVFLRHIRLLRDYPIIGWGKEGNPIVGRMSSMNNCFFLIDVNKLMRCISNAEPNISRTIKLLFPHGAVRVNNGIGGYIKPIPQKPSPFPSPFASDKISDYIGIKYGIYSFKQFDIEELNRVAPNLGKTIAVRSDRLTLCIFGTFMAKKNHYDYVYIPCAIVINIYTNNADPFVMLSLTKKMIVDVVPLKYDIDFFIDSIKS